MYNIKKMFVIYLKKKKSYTLCQKKNIIGYFCKNENVNILGVVS